MFYHRILCFALWGTLLLVAAGCGGNAASFSLVQRGLGVTAAEDAGATYPVVTPADLLVDGKAPLFVSERGPALYALDARGLPVDAEIEEFSVTEKTTGDGSLEWVIKDEAGHEREFYFRITAAEDGITPEITGDGRAPWPAPTAMNQHRAWNHWG